MHISVMDIKQHYVASRKTQLSVLHAVSLDEIPLAMVCPMDELS